MCFHDAAMGTSVSPLCFARGLCGDSVTLPWRFHDAYVILPLRLHGDPMGTFMLSLCFHMSVVFPLDFRAAFTGTSVVLPWCFHETAMVRPRCLRNAACFVGLQWCFRYATVYRRRPRFKTSIRRRGSISHFVATIKRSLSHYWLYYVGLVWYPLLRSDYSVPFRVHLKKRASMCFTTKR